MRNLKKILALALVFAMAFTFTAGAADFTDKAEIGASYVDDVNMLVELGVIAGYPDGSFGPQKNITRAEFAKMAYTLKYGSDTNGDLFAAQKSTFTDVEGNANVAWAKGYINYCANQKIVSGVGNNKFNPQGNITVAEATKMILVILGCDPAKEGFTGANWASNVTAKAIDLGIFKGWTGDPTALATRELVAKLMKNAIFSPVYAYSPITGAGSQLRVIPTDDGDIYNDTLGEMTMDLVAITGIIVANENYEITKNADGEPIEGAPECDDEETVVYYEIKGTDGDPEARYVTLPVTTEDALLGNEVSVFFKADLTSDKWYTNVELIGDIMVTNDTVVYEVPALAVDMYPNGESESDAAVAPYISFTVDGVEKQVKAPKTAGKIAKNVDVQTAVAGAAVRAEFANYAWTSNVDADGAAGEDAVALANGEAVNARFFADMGMPVLSNYRFVSVDGGKTYSYIFKMVTDDDTNANVGNVTNYSEAKGSITISGLVPSKRDLEDVNIIGDVATDDMVVYFYENEILNIAKVDTMTGAVEEINEDGSVVINGETYALWINHNIDDFGDIATLGQYFTSNPSALNDNTTYYVYGNIVLDIEVGETEAVVEDYAVILKSSYDAGKELAYVTLAFADNTQGTYEVGKLHLENSRNPYASENDKAADFDGNAFFGMVVKYKVMSDGKLDLSANDFGKIIADTDGVYPGSKITYETNALEAADPHAVAAEGVLTLNDGTTQLYAANDSAVIFVLYGNPQYGIERTEDYAPMRAKAYKLVDKVDQPLAAVANLMVDGNNDRANWTLSYAVNTNTGLNRGVVAAAMTIELEGDTGDAEAGEALAYIASSTLKFNVATQEYYFLMTLIDENGLVSTKTVDSVADFNNSAIETGEAPLGKYEGEDYSAGNFINYTLNAEGVITNMEPWEAVEESTAEAIESGDQGLYVVNVVRTSADRLFYIPLSATLSEGQTIKDLAQMAAMFAEDGYEVIAIDGDDYVGESISKLSSKTDELSATKGNAVIQVVDGEIIRVFSFVEGYNTDDNTGDDNTGDDNTGDDNTGDDNTGDDNTGDDNTGDDNTGDDNTGDDNTGDDNTGDDNTGDDNTGDDNTGDDNTGDDNTGDE